MAQAETIPTTSRRSFLAAVAAGTVVAPSIAMAEPAPDAELIDLGKKLSKLTQEYYSEVARFRPLWDEHERLMNEWNEANPIHKEGEAIAAYYRINAEIGMDAAEKANHPDDVMDRIAPVSTAILAIPATTWAGVIVKAQLARFGADHFWDQSEDDTDWDKIVMRKLCDAVIDMAAQTAAGTATS
jgi:hypothetical protein